MGFVWLHAPEDAFRDLYDVTAAHLYQSALRLCQARAPEIENWMKRNAPWTDRTGNARQTLYAEVIPAIGEIVVLVSHGMDYGIYLETKYSGRYAIIGPTIDHFLPLIMGDIQRLVNA